MSEPAGTSDQTQVFDLARRGYDRRQVDQHMQTLLQTLSETQQAHQQEHTRASRAETELQQARSQLENQASQLADGADGQGGEPQKGFGYRVEKLLRAAELEATEVRSAAAREATALLERAREDAETHRHEVEHSLIVRTAAIEQNAAQRTVQLDERERQIDEHTEAARTEAERMLSEVRHHADQIRQDAQVRAEQERVRAERLIRERQEAAEHELGRLRTLHDEVRGQLARLLESLAGEFRPAESDQGQRPAQAPEHHWEQRQQRPQPRPRQLPTVNPGEHRAGERVVAPAAQRSPAPEAARNQPRTAS